MNTLLPTAHFTPTHPPRVPGVEEFTGPVFDALRLKVERMGAWAGVRWLRNLGIQFNQAHFIVTGFYPRYPE